MDKWHIRNLSNSQHLLNIKIKSYSFLHLLFYYTLNSQGEWISLLPILSQGLCGGHDITTGSITNLTRYLLSSPPLLNSILLLDWGYPPYPPYPPDSLACSLLHTRIQNLCDILADILLFQIYSPSILSSIALLLTYSVTTWIQYISPFFTTWDHINIFHRQSLFRVPPYLYNIHMPKCQFLYICWIEQYDPVTTHIWLSHSSKPLESNNLLDLYIPKQ